ncbi:MULTISPECIES: hypothetical protein [Sphingobacterium]|uniref:Uncharacterized protein n=1 Tax=Sphingobacterium multivorum TaxID=28454 RepID=A0A654BBK9_SPHMU|nr:MULTISPECIES: hypothetical protein [Sphingobacterium]OFV09370.1 hypothetical protein HMPREF3127_23455 [Sphingobacterium sp. HMSC13C05]VXC76799.1 conserved hypothetical protein [Sphingobacterium multivorum]
MKKIVDKIAKVLQVILLTPVKLPNKVLNIAKYIAFGLGIVDSVLEKDTGEPATEERTASANMPDGRSQVDVLDYSPQADHPDMDKKAVKRTRGKGGADALE